MKMLFTAILAILFCPPAILAGGAEKSEYFASFDPANGFKPARRDLTEIFLQIAGSLEYYGSPVPYMRHMVKEHARIEALYQRKYGSAHKSFRPAYMTDAYLDRFSSNWDILSPKLGLEPFAKEVGNTMRDAIKGTRGTGTIIVEILNQHQSRVFDALAGKGRQGADFETLKSQLITRLELDKEVVDEGGYEVAHRDAVSYAIIIHGITMKLFKRLDQALNPADAERIKTALSSAFTDVGRMAQSELEAGLSEWALQHQSTAAK
jgi:hypothetical protein